MSDQPMGPDWWMASDHKWYPPELHPSKSSDQPAGTASSTTQDAPTDGEVVAEAGEDGWRVGPAGDSDRYTLHERHSRGNEGDLWRASLLLDDVEVPIALKVTHPEDVSDLDEAKQRWQRQADLLGSLDHPGLVKVRELFYGAAPHRPGGADPSTTVLCLAMNWADGERLDDWVKARPERTLDDAVGVLDKVAGALDYLHTGVGGRPVLHRNLKPGNILVDGDDVRLVGFGTARLMKLDAQMTIVGTPAWMPPEVLNGESYDQAADLWSLGAIAFYLACGGPPPLLSVDKARDQLVASTMFADRPAVAEDVCRLLDPTPGNRPTSAREWVDGVRAALSGAAPASPAPAPVAEPVPEPVPAPLPEPEPVADPAPAAVAEPAPSPWAPESDQAAQAEPAVSPALDLGKPADVAPPAEPAAVAPAPVEAVAAEPVPGEPVWDEATQSWRDPASGSVWDPATETWAPAPEAAPTAPEVPPDPSPTFDAAPPPQAAPPPDVSPGPDLAPPPEFTPAPAAPAADAGVPPPPDGYVGYSAPPAEGQYAPPPGDPGALAPPGAPTKSRTPLIIGVVVAAIVVVVLIVLLLVL